ncbi:hypothetical protein SCA6_006538 [Theobroma cacao]
MSDETRNRNDERGELKNSQEWFNFVNEMASGYIPTQGRNDRYRNGAIYNSDWNSIQVVSLRASLLLFLMVIVVISDG